MTERESPPHSVVVTDIRMPFWSMVVFFIKAALAVIPASVILAAIGAGVFVLLGGVGAGLRRASGLSENTSTSLERTGAMPVETAHTYTTGPVPAARVGLASAEVAHAIEKARADLASGNKKSAAARIKAAAMNGSPNAAQSAELYELMQQATER
jgi:hypothetical protein